MSAKRPRRRVAAGARLGLQHGLKVERGDDQRRRLALRERCRAGGHRLGRCQLHLQAAPAHLRVKRKDRVWISKGMVGLRKQCTCKLCDAAWAQL